MRSSYSTSRSASITHTQISCVLDICLAMTHTCTLSYPCLRLIACVNTYLFFTFTGASPLHACGVTRNWRTYFISVRQVIIVESRIADCTVKPPGVERPFSSISYFHCKLSHYVNDRCCDKCKKRDYCNTAKDQYNRSYGNRLS